MVYCHQAQAYAPDIPPSLNDLAMITALPLKVCKPTDNFLGFGSMLLRSGLYVNGGLFHPLRAWTFRLFHYIERSVWIIAHMSNLNVDLESAEEYLPLSHTALSPGIDILPHTHPQIGLYPVMT